MIFSLENIKNIIFSLENITVLLYHWYFRANPEQLQDRAIQWQTNSKSYMFYRKTPYLATLNDPYPRFQGHTIIWCWI